MTEYREYISSLGPALKHLVLKQDMAFTLSLMSQMLTMGLQPAYLIIWTYIATRNSLLWSYICALHSAQMSRPS